ncbi:MAG: adenine phosphoribosyltransferase [Nanoarchaeota archaeon]
MDLKSHIREVPDYPKPGILFYDITTLLGNAAAFKESVDRMYALVKNYKIDKVIGIESRGYIFGAPLALKLNTSFIPIRKPGKLPSKIISESYSLEYGKNTLEMHEDAINSGENVLLVDDLLATGGTTVAAINMVEKLKGNVIAVVYLIELDFLKGRKKLDGYNTHSVLHYDK